MKFNVIRRVFAVWYYFGAIGSFIFILMQLILLVDFAHTWNQNWVENAENGNGKCWYAGEMTLCSIGPTDNQRGAVNITRTWMMVFYILVLTNSTLLMQLTCTRTYL